MTPSVPRRERMARQNRTQSTPNPTPVLALKHVQVPDDVLALRDHEYAGPIVARALAIAQSLDSEIAQSLAARADDGPDEHVAHVHRSMVRSATEAAAVLARVADLDTEPDDAMLGDLASLTRRWSGKGNGARPPIERACQNFADFRTAVRLRAEDDGEKLAKLARPYALVAVDTSALERACTAARAAGEIS